MKIAMTSVFVPDPLAAFKFYTGVLGFIEKVYMPEMRLAIVAAPDDPDGTQLLLEPNQNLGADKFQKTIYDADLPIIVFGTDDIQRDYEQMLKKGVVFRKPPTKTEWGTETVFEDTCGNLIQLHQV